MLIHICPQLSSPYCHKQIVLSEWMNEWMIKMMSEQLSVWISELMNEWMNEWMSDLCWCDRTVLSQLKCFPFWFSNHPILGSLENPFLLKIPHPCPTSPTPNLPFCQIPDSKYQFCYSFGFVYKTFPSSPNHCSPSVSAHKTEQIQKTPHPAKGTVVLFSIKLCFGVFLIIYTSNSPFLNLFFRAWFPINCTPPLNPIFCPTLQQPKRLKTVQKSNAFPPITGPDSMFFPPFSLPI